MVSKMLQRMEKRARDKRTTRIRFNSIKLDFQNLRVEHAAYLHLMLLFVEEKLKGSCGGNF